MCAGCALITKPVDPSDRLVWLPADAAQFALWFAQKEIPLEDGSQALLPVMVITPGSLAFQRTSAARPTSPPSSGGVRWTVARHEAHAHRARPFRQSKTDPTSSRLLPPSPGISWTGCRQLH